MAKQPKQDWKTLQLSYHHLLGAKAGVHNHHQLTYSVERVKAAMQYVIRPSRHHVQPAHSRMMAIVYATMIEKIYGEDFYDTLNDPQLFLGHDNFFQPYLEDSDVYDAIIAELKNIPDWMTRGSIPEFIKKFNLECTQEGIDSFKSNSMTV